MWRPARTTAVAAAASVVLVAVLVVVHSRSSGPARGPTAPVGRTPDATLGWSYTLGQTSLWAVVAVPRHGSPVVVAVPPDLQIDLAGSPPVVAAALGATGPRMVEAAQAVLGRRVQHYVVSSAISLAAAIDSAGGASVEVEAPFSTRGRTIRAGTQRIAGLEVEAYLSAAATPQDLFLRWQGVLDGFFASSSRVTSSLGLSDDPAIVARIVRAAQGARLEAVPTLTGVDGLVRPDMDGIDALVATRMPTAGGPIVRVVVINGSGRPGVADALALRLSPLGYQIVAAQNDSKRDEWTQVLAAGQRFVVDAERVRSLIASGTVYVDAQPTGLADVTIVVGKDLSIG
jgi:hypothetical protein